MTSRRLPARLPCFAALALACLCFAPRPARAAPDPEPDPNLLLADLGLHVLGIGYQRTLSPWLALQLDVESYTPWTQNINLFNASQGYQSDLTGYVIRFRPIFFGLFQTQFPAGNAPTGFWLSPFGQYGIASATYDGVKEKGHVWAAGLSGGWAWLFFNHLSLLLGAGAQYHVAIIPAAGVYPPSFARLYPTVDLNIGYAF